MGTKYNPSIVRNGLVFCVDPANLASYSGSGLTVYGLVSGIGGTLVNGIGLSSQNTGSFFYDDYFTCFIIISGVQICYNCVLIAYCLYMAKLNEKQLA
jgi:hypothetical protein